MQFQCTDSWGDRNVWLFKIYDFGVCIVLQYFHQGYKTAEWASVWEKYRNCTEKPKIVHKNGSFWNASWPYPSTKTKDFPYQWILLGQSFLCYQDESKDCLQERILLEGKLLSKLLYETYLLEMSWPKIHTFTYAWQCGNGWLRKDLERPTKNDVHLDLLEEKSKRSMTIDQAATVDLVGFRQKL